jgi:DNA-directed RNA polymerase specialized sigma24 family protein
MLEGHTSVGRMLEEEVEAMLETYGTVFVARHVEPINAAEVADILNITRENVKMRFCRARAFLRKKLFLRAGATLRRLSYFTPVGATRS